MYCIYMDQVGPTTGSLVWHLAMRWRAEVDRAVAPLGLTHAQYSVLASLHVMTERGANPSQRELAEFSQLQTIYVSKLVRALEGAGCVAREAHSTDARAVRLSLTEAGRATIVAARKTVRALDDRLTEPLGGSKGRRTADLGGMLRTLIDHHDRIGNTDDDVTPAHPLSGQG